ncbi:MAG: hypothetical protein ACJAV6_000234 [Candidatus Paceibacteria bacterium]
MGEFVYYFKYKGNKTTLLVSIKKNIIYTIFMKKLLIIILLFLVIILTLGRALNRSYELEDKTRFGELSESYETNILDNMWNKLLNKMNPSRTWEPKQIIVVGTRPATEVELNGITLREGEVGFVVIASEDGTSTSEQYISETFYSQPDDIWLTGAIDGKPVTVLINPKNREQYKLDTWHIEPVSQYS